MTNAEKIVTGFIAAVIIIAIFSLFYVSKSLFFPLKTNPDTNIPTSNAIGNAMGQKMSKMSLTSFDSKLAKKFMDKDNDGKCDSCGMDVELCIDSGQLQCNMDSSSTIGILGSQHIHADLKIYINGKALGEDTLGLLAMDMSKMDSDLTSSFIHFDKGALEPEEDGNVIHMHASGVPLWIFFESVGMEFSKDCITLENKDQYCNEGNKKLKFYVDGKLNGKFENYVFNDLDKILISYGSEDEEEIQKQLESITDFAKSH